MENINLFSLRLNNVPTVVKLLITCFLITIGVGYCISIINLNYQYSMLDGKPGVTPADLKRAFFGDRSNTRIAAKINGGSMEQYLPDPAEKNKILNWVQDGAHEEEFNSTIKPILSRNCMRCHSPVGVMSQRPLTAYLEVMEVVKIDRGEPPALWSRVAHTHIQAIGVIIFLLGALFVFTSVSNKIKTVVIVLPFVSLLSDFGLRFLAKYNADLVYVLMTTGALLGLSLAAMIIVPLYEMWIKK